MNVFSVKKICFVLGLIFINHIKAQDSLFFLNKNSIAAKVLEIGVDEIKYKRFDNIEGPLYIVSRNEVGYIKYTNGKTDSVYKPKSTALNYQTSIQNNNYKSKILVAKNRLVYNGRNISEYKLFSLINQVPENENKTLMITEYKKMMQYKSKQYFYGFTGLGVGVALPISGLALYSVTDSSIPFAIGLLSGVSVAVTGAIISKIHKSKRVKKYSEIADLYNK
jgi:uncharacterized membrane protein